MDHARDELGPAVCRQREQLLRDQIEVFGQTAFDVHPTVFGIVPVVAVGQQRHAELRSRVGEGQVIDDPPQLLLGRFDQTLHRSARVETDDEIDRAFLCLRHNGRVAGCAFVKTGEEAHGNGAGKCYPMVKHGSSPE